MHLIALNNSEAELIFEEITRGITFRLEGRLLALQPGKDGVTKAADLVLKKILASIYDQTVIRADYTRQAALNFTQDIILSINKPIRPTLIEDIRQKFFGQINLDDEKIKTKKAMEWPLSVMLTAGNIEYNNVVYSLPNDPPKIKLYELPPRRVFNLKEIQDSLNQPSTNKIEYRPAGRFENYDPTHLLAQVQYYGTELRHIGQHLETNNQANPRASTLVTNNFKKQHEEKTREETAQAASFKKVFHSSKALPPIPNKTEPSQHFEVTAKTFSLET